MQRSFGDCVISSIFQLIAHYRDFTDFSLFIRCFEWMYSGKLNLIIFLLVFSENIIYAFHDCAAAYKQKFPFSISFIPRVCRLLLNHFRANIASITIILNPHLLTMYLTVLHGTLIFGFLILVACPSIKIKDEQRTFYLNVFPKLATKLR